MPTKEEKRAYNTLYMRRARALCREIGLCVGCMIGIPRDGWRTCNACIQKRVDARRGRKHVAKEPKAPKLAPQQIPKFSIRKLTSVMSSDNIDMTM